MNKLWYIQTVEYKAALKRNELSSHKKTWRKTLNASLNEANMILLYDILEKAKLWRK